MEIEYLDKFSKDLDRIKDKIVKQKIEKFIIAVKSAEKITELSSIKKLQGSTIAYRFRIGDYRLCFYYENNIVEIARILHRKEAYSFFSLSLP